MQVYVGVRYKVQHYFVLNLNARLTQQRLQLNERSRTFPSRPRVSDCYNVYITNDVHYSLPFWPEAMLSNTFQALTS